MRAALRSTPNPRRITIALDTAGLHGPAVDAALGVEEPTVDRWESGDEIPTKAQVRRLAMLCGFTWWWFYQLAEPPSFDSVFVCRGGLS